MNLDLVVDQSHSYRQAVQIAYEKAKRNGGVDELTAQECERVLSEPEPDYVYHEVKLDSGLRLHDDGCVSFRTLSARDFYEHLKLEARQRAAECLASEMDEMWQEIKKRNGDIDSKVLKELSFSIDEKATIRPVSAPGTLSSNDSKLLFEMLNNHPAFKEAAKEYVWLLAGVVNRTVDGLSGEYARHFKAS